MFILKEVAGVSIILKDYGIDPSIFKKIKEIYGIDKISYTNTNRDAVDPKTGDIPVGDFFKIQFKDGTKQTVSVDTIKEWEQQVLKSMKAPWILEMLRNFKRVFPNNEIKTDIFKFSYKETVEHLQSSVKGKGFQEYEAVYDFSDVKNPFLDLRVKEERYDIIERINLIQNPSFCKTVLNEGIKKKNLFYIASGPQGSYSSKVLKWDVNERLIKNYIDSHTEKEMGNRIFDFLKKSKGVLIDLDTDHMNSSVDTYIYFRFMAYPRREIRYGQCHPASISKEIKSAVWHNPNPIPWHTMAQLFLI